MPFFLRKVKGNKYFVVDTSGNQYSKKPLSKTRAEKQLTALHINTGHGLYGSGNVLSNAVGFLAPRDLTEAEKQTISSKIEDKLYQHLMNGRIEESFPINKNIDDELYNAGLLYTTSYFEKEEIRRNARENATQRFDDHMQHQRDLEAIRLQNEQAQQERLVELQQNKEQQLKHRAQKTEQKAQKQAQKSQQQHGKHGRGMCGGIAIQMDKRPNSLGHYPIKDMRGNFIDLGVSQQDGVAKLSKWYKMTNYYQAIDDLTTSLRGLLAMDLNQHTLNYIDLITTTLKKYCEEFLADPANSAQEKANVREILHKDIPSLLKDVQDPENSQEALGFGKYSRKHGGMMKVNPLSQPTPEQVAKAVIQRILNSANSARAASITNPEGHKSMEKVMNEAALELAKSGKAAAVQYLNELRAPLESRAEYKAEDSVERNKITRELGFEVKGGKSGSRSSQECYAEPDTHILIGDYLQGSGFGKWTMFIQELGRIEGLTPERIATIVRQNDEIRDEDPRERFRLKRQNVIDSFPRRRAGLEAVLVYETFDNIRALQLIEALRGARQRQNPIHQAQQLAVQGAVPGNPAQAVEAVDMITNPGCLGVGCGKGKLNFVKKYLRGQGLRATKKNVDKICNIMDVEGVVFD